MNFSESNPLGHVLLKRCREAGYDCHLVHSEEEVIEQLEEMKRHQAVIVVDAYHKTAGSSAAAAGKTFSPGKRVPESSLEKLSRLGQRWELGLFGETPPPQKKKKKKMSVGQ